jgi:acyl-CoA thioester hydrolase
MNTESPAGSRVQIRVRYAETDQMGRAHHMQYVAWFELGRTELMREHGVSYAELETRGTLLLVSRVEIEYLQGVGFDELVEIHTWVSSVRSRTLEFSYEVSLVDGDVLARGATTLVCANAEGRPRRLSEEVRGVLERLMEAA